MHIVTAGNSAILRLLGSRALRRVPLERHIARSGSDALDLIKMFHPALAILDAQMPDVDGFAVCRSIKADPETSGCRVMLVTAGVLGRSALERIAQAGCDDVLVMPAADEEVLAHVAELLAIPRRKDRRVTVELLAQIESGPRTWAGRVENLSRGGAKIVLEEPLSGISRVRARFTREPGGRAVVVDARVAWRQEDERAGGLEFTNVGDETRRQLDALVLWDVVEEGGILRAFLDGDFVEQTDFSGLEERLSGNVDFDAEGVRYINSIGSRLWTAFLNRLRDVDSYTFSRCSQAFTTQASLILDFIGKGDIVSAFAPYHCEKCDVEEPRLLQRSALAMEAGRILAPRFHCPECQGQFVLDEDPDRYFAFLHRD